MLIRCSQLEEAVLVCEAIRERASRASFSSWRAYYAAGFFDKATLHGRSLVSLVNMYKKRAYPLDISGICVLSRCILEVHNASAYLLEPGLTKGESELRFQLFRLNHSVDLRRINKGLGINESDDRNSFNDVALWWSEDELQKNSTFLSLDEPHRKALLKGRSPYLTARYAGKKPIPHAIESAVYNLFSHNVHSFSLGLSPMSGGSATPAGGVNMSFLAVEIARIYLCTIALHYWRLRSRAIKGLAQQERNTLEDGVASAHLDEWLSALRLGAKSPSI